MKRRRLLITGVLLLLGGAIVNVAVAWGCAVFLLMDSPFYEYSCEWRPLSDFGVGKKGFVRVQRTDRFGSTQVRLSVGDFDRWPSGEANPLTIANCPDWCRPQLTNMLSRWFTLNLACLEARGWPLRSMWCEPARFNPARLSFDDPIGGFRVEPHPLSASKYWVKPTIPFVLIWPGFAINTIFYAAMLWMVFFVPGMVRRRLRRRRGLCPVCAYPIGTSPVCTECGRSLLRTLKA